ncbi:MAG: ABC transporter ATP-binding protein [Desulfamplus sp.]|nr:ABC transporter ATP-binding protein [Desulfamplus sp.]
MILKLSNLVVSFETESGRVRAVDGVSFSLKEGQILGIVGESGCGKSVTALSIMGLLPKPFSKIESGVIEFKGRDIVPLMGNQTKRSSKNAKEKKEKSKKEKSDDMQKIRGRKISMIFQEPMTALNPVHKIGSQMNEVYQLHFPQMNRADMDRASIEMLYQVGIATPQKLMQQYPHQLSGGMRQRVMIAMALSSKPDILIADEPTTALDVTVQAQILELIGDLKNRFSMSVILITHDLGVIAENCEQAIVMYGGRVAERAGVVDLFDNPLHPYTQGLLKSIPTLNQIPKSTLPTIKGRVPSLEDMPSGCRFSNRCERVMDICRVSVPIELNPKNDHFVACHLFR